MPANFNLPHLNLSDKKAAQDYTAPKRNMGGGAAPRIREEHGALLQAQLRSAYQAIIETPSPDGITERSGGAYYEVELRKGANAEALDRKRAGIVSGATKIVPETDSYLTTVLYIPDDAIAVLDAVLEDYRAGALTQKGEPPKKSYVEPIESIRRARLFSFWTDSSSALPQEAQASIWWEVWCAPNDAQPLADFFDRADCRVADPELWLQFPEVTVLPVYARRADIEVALFACKGISELRRGSDTPTFFVEDERHHQHDWAQNLAERIVWPSRDVPRVCLLDTGVNRSHVLIEPALSEQDLMSANPDWVATDNQPDSHGTEMAGLALHGDLFAQLQDGRNPRLTHRLESVRIMPANGFPANQPARLGSITQSAVSLAEIQNPGQERVFCMAITNEDVSGERATAWSACVDRTAAGLMAGDEDDRPRRLFMISAGNIPAEMNAGDFLPLEDYHIEDPAQAWNALTIGGYTDKTVIGEPQLSAYTAVSSAGDLSPYSRTSLGWRGKGPIKPEIVFEAGNRARSTNGLEFISCPSLELLTTGADVNRFPIVNFSATSAATALAARFAARLKADHSDFWPETIRALMVHSAQWTPPMLDQLNATLSLRDRQKLIRKFGYGVPSYDKATASASNDLALVVQQEIQPYKKVDNYVGFNECHYYPLPWPRRILESADYAAQEFLLTVTLSYFVEPNPGRAAAIDPQKYQSFGLRFDLKRARETQRQFRHRINAEEAMVGAAGNVTDAGWMFGSSSVSAGSLHSDVWRGTGAELAARDAICVKPVSGWWKERKNPDICHRSARYAMIVTLSAPGLEIDLYTPIKTAIEQPIGIEVEL